MNDHTTVPYRAVIILDHFFDSERDPLPDEVELYAGWKLQRPTESHQDIQYLEKLIAPLEFERLQTNDAFILVKEFEVEGSNSNARNQSQVITEVEQESIWISLAFRMLRPAAFVPYRLVLRDDPEDERAGFVPTIGRVVHDRHFIPSGYSEEELEYRAADVEKLQKYTEFILKYYGEHRNTFKKILVAADLYNESLKSYRYETKLLVAVAALEALFTYSNAGVTEQLASMVTVFNRFEPSQRLAHSREISKLYDVRSRIVHGEELRRAFYADHATQAATMRLAYESLGAAFERIIMEEQSNLFETKEMLKQLHRRLSLGLETDLT